MRLGRLARPPARLARAVAVLERAELRRGGRARRARADAAARRPTSSSAAGILEPGRPLAFAHPIVRAAVYGELPSAERAAGHRRAAELLDAEPAAAERAAEHLLATEPAGDAWVVERLAAAARARPRGAARRSRR